MKIVKGVRLAGYAGLVLFAALVAGCGSSGSSSSSEPTATVSGAVVDGYVRNATVTLYDLADFAGPHALATGTTDQNGDFHLTLPASELPTRIAMLSRGGTVIDTGMPAPTLALVAMLQQDHYYITPLTDRIAVQGLRAGSSFVDAESSLANELGLTTTELYDDPLSSTAPSQLTQALYRTLAAGDYTVTPPNGDYKLSLIHLGKAEIDNPTAFSSIADLVNSQQVTGDLTISNGTVTGTLSTGDTVTGRVNGPALILNVAYSGGVTRVAGTMGLLGSVSGNYVDYDNNATGNPLSTGVFVGSLVPASGVDATGVKTLVENLYAGDRNSLFRDLYGDSDLGWGRMSGVTVNTTNDTISSNDFSINLNGTTSDNLTYQAGKLLTLSGGGLNGLAVMRYTDNSGDYGYMIQALGNRRGIYVAAGGTSPNDAYAVGESYLSRQDAVGGDSFTAAQGTTMNLAVSGIDAGMLGVQRDPTSLVDTSVSFKVPTLTNRTGFSGSADTSGGVIVISGSMLAVKDSSSGTSPTAMDSSNDFSALAEINSSGAFAGDAVTGGTLANLGGADASQWPVPLVGYAAPNGTDTSLLNFGDVELKFAAHPMYMLDTQTGNVAALSDYQQSVITGVIKTGSRSDQATMSYTDGQGTTGTANLAMTNNGGLYHLQGAIGGTDYIDILWPAGGHRAVYMVSDKATGDGKVSEIGEVIMSY